MLNSIVQSSTFQKHINSNSAGKILIVDDGKALMLALCDILRNHGYETTGFTSAREALRIIPESKFDLLLSDLNMPEMDGITLMDAALKLDPDLAGIIMTGDGSITSAVQAMKSGSFDYILKPFKLNAILPVLARALNSRQQRLQDAARLQHQREHEALHDTLTGLPNRSLFMKRLSGVIPQSGQEGGSITVVLANLKRFKDINDSFGRAVGDALLRQVSGRLSSVIENAGSPARIDADTFAWISGGSSGQGNNLQTVQECINQVFSQPFIVAGNEFRLGTQAGIACFPDHGADAEVLFNNAEAALKHARHQHEALACYSAELHARVTERLKMESKLRRAIEREEFVLYFQPKVDVKIGNISSLEALIRWQDPEVGLVPPIAFIPLLEETGMIVQVSRWLLRETARITAVWQEKGLPLVPVAINVSPIDLRQQDFVQSVEETLRNWPAGAPRFTLEITESAIMEDINLIGPKLKVIEHMGVEIAIDDFGTGYSSLAYLAKLPAKVIKIDRAFIRDIEKNEESRSIVSLIVSLAHSLKKKVVAEGVETEAQLDCLRQLKCEEYQGYLFSKPQPAEKIETMLAVSDNRKTGSFKPNIADYGFLANAGLMQAC